MYVFVICVPWGFFSKNPSLANPLTGKLSKPEEHQNEFGFTFSGPILKNRLFFFVNYNKYLETKGPFNAFETIPTTAEINGDFSAIGTNIYDPSTCPSGNAGNCQRTQYSYNGKSNVISPSKQSAQALFLQKFLPPPTNQNATSNYLGGYKTGFDNYTITGKADYTITSKQTASVTIGWGQQNTVGASAQTKSNSTTFQQLPAPYINANVFNPQTRVVILDHTYVINSRMVNQFKYGFASYDGSNENLAYEDQFSAATAGITGLPPGQASGSFPGVQFSGTAAPNYWGGFTGTHKSINDFTLVDNFNLNVGRHSLTAGFQIAWLEYNYDPNVGSSTVLSLSFAPAQTGCYAASSTGSSCGSSTTASNVVSSTGLAYASFLAGAASSGKFTTTTVEEVGARWRPVSPYIQDDWKINSKLTVNLGLRWDYYPTYTESKNRLSFLDPNATNPITGTPGALSFAGSGSDPAYCHCRTNVQNWYKNFGPRLGFAYSAHPDTIVRGSFGIVYAHGNGNGGSSISQQGTGLLGYSASPSYSSPSASLPAFYLQNGVPSYTPPPFINAGYGTGYYTGGNSPQSISYGDPVYGDRASEFILWSFGIQQAFTKSMTLTATYVGSEGHFLPSDSQTARGKWINQLDPKYLSLGSYLGTAINKLPAGVTLASLGVALPYSNFDLNQSVAQALKPFPQYNSISDSYGAVANSNYHALQTSLTQRYSRGVSFTVNYTWAKNIDDTGSFRSGYAIPAAYSQTGQTIPADRAERALSLADRRHNLVAFGVFDSPFGTLLMADNRYVKAIAGGFKLSTIFTAYSGSPLAITGATCGTNPAQGTCLPTYNPSFTGPARMNGSWGAGATSSNVAVNFINPNAFSQTGNYVFGNVARTAPYGLTGPGNYDIDLSLRRIFHMPHYDFVHLTIEGDLYNLTNHVQFGGINTSFGNGSFGQVTSQANSSRDAQLSARIEF